MDNLLSAQAFAAKLGISMRMLEDLILQGKTPPYIKLGRLRRWHPTQVDAWIIEQFSAVNSEVEAKASSQTKAVTQ
ncbi:MAG TPA: helix-turn-helix domain-containing protein [Rhodocyclaceae bacterium]